MRKAATKEEALSAFEARLMALSAAQDVLTRSSWSAATMAQIVHGALMPHRPAQSDRVKTGGPTTNLAPQTALSFVLAFHELATNATKYGALSNDSGTVSIRWAVKEREGQAVFSCVWQEKGGPQVETPTRKGFGTRLIKAGFARAFKVEIDYAPEGLRAIFEASVAAL
jgi:two-component sensor histidine kinase